MQEGEGKGLEKAAHYMCTQSMYALLHDTAPSWLSHIASHDSGLTLLTSIWIWFKTRGGWKNPSGAQVTRKQMP